MTNLRFQELFNLCIIDKASVDERQEFFRLADLHENEALNIELIEEYLSKEQDKLSLNPEITQEIFQAILAAAATPAADFKSAAGSLPDTLDAQPAVPVHRVYFLKTAWFRYAAILLLIAGTAVYLFTTLSLFRRNAEVTKIITTPKEQDILPGGNRAILTLSDGSTITLDSASNGNLAQQGNMQIVKLGNGQMRYEVLKQGANKGGEFPGEGSKIAYNTISTPKGGQYKVVLSDGSKIWLNAASSISFPASFAGKERKVEVKGEAYFEVAKDAAHAFIVQVNQATIEVLGTSFNVMAYTNEASLQTTLLEGSVRFSESGKQVLLKPGQQASLLPGQNIILNNHIDTDHVVAWKNGIQSFNNADIKTIMRQVERWYDVEVEYQGNLSKRAFTGDIPRSASLSELLQLFEVNKISCTMDAEHKKIIIRP